MLSKCIAPGLVVILLGMLAADALAGDTPFAGKYTDGNLSLELTASGDGYTGTILLNNQKFPATARVRGQGLAGAFTSGADSFPFTAALDADVLTFTTDASVYKLKKASAVANPLAFKGPANPLAAPAQAEDGPKGYAVIATTTSGKSLTTKKPNVAKLNDALVATFSDLATYFGVKPELGTAFQDAHDASSGGATFSVTLNGKPNRGIISCKIRQDGASISVIFGQADGPKSEWDKLMSPAVVPDANAGAAQPEIAPTTYNYPDGTGSLDLPGGWATQAQGAIDLAVIVGPNGDFVYLHDGINVQMPDSPIAQGQMRMQAQQLEMQRRMPNYRPKPMMPFLIAPYGEPVTALKTLTPQFSHRSELNQGPTFAIDEVISSQELPCKINGGKRARIDYTLTKSIDGKTIKYRAQAVILTAPFPGNAAWMYNAQFVAMAPVDVFENDLPVMLAIAKSEKVDQEKAFKLGQERNQRNYQLGQQLIADNQRQFESFMETNRRNFQTQMDIHRQQQAQTEAGYAAHNQQFRDDQLRRSRNAADFNESILGTRMIYDRATGQSGYARLTDVNGVVNSLNEAALDPNRFIQVPLRDQLYPMPAGR